MLHSKKNFPKRQWGQEVEGAEFMNLWIERGEKPMKQQLGVSLYQPTSPFLDT